MTCNYDGLNLKISVSYEELKHVFSVTVNGINYYDLPYEALQQSDDDEDDQIIQNIQVNGVQVLCNK